MARPKDPQNLYELTPRRRRDFEERDDGTVDVLVPRYGGGRVGRLLRSVLNNKPVRVQLDDIGTKVWRLCDGRRTVLDIGTELQDAYGERIEPLYDRLGQFLEQMRKSGLIDLSR
jgi:hypothetical protein